MLPTHPTRAAHGAALLGMYKHNGARAPCLTLNRPGASAARRLQRPGDDPLCGNGRGTARRGRSARAARGPVERRRICEAAPGRDRGDGARRGLHDDRTEGTTGSAKVVRRGDVGGEGRDGYEGGIYAAQAGPPTGRTAAAGIPAGRPAGSTKAATGTHSLTHGRTNCRAEWGGGRRRRRRGGTLATGSRSRFGWGFQHTMLLVGWHTGNTPAQNIKRTPGLGKGVARWGKRLRTAFVEQHHQGVDRGAMRSFLNSWLW